MKNLKLSLLSISVAAIVLSACGGLTKMVENSSSVSYDVNPSPLEVHAGEVEVTIKTQFPEKYFNKKAVVDATPVLVYQGGESAYETTTLQGESVEANNKVISFLGGDYTYTGKVPYKPEMLSSALEVQMSAKIGENEPIEIPGIKVADGVIATSTLVEIDPKAVLVGDKFERITPASYESEILFVINRAEVRNSELSKAEIKAFQDNVKAAQANERIEIKNAEISSYASPDGEVDLNEKLSKNRGTSAERYLSRTLKKLKVEGADTEEFLKVASTAEDWDGFKELMQASDIQDKELILRVLSMYSDPVVREKEIKNIAQAFEEIKDDVLPKLRRSQMVINAEQIGYSDEEISELAKSNPDTLKIEEILYAATLTDDSAEKLRIYQVAAKNYPECFRAINNVGYIYLSMGKVAEAKDAFSKAQAIKDNDVAKNNLGAIALIEGDITKAEELFTAAMGAGEVVNYNLGIIKVKQADYAAAVNYFGNKPSVNAGIAQILNGDIEKAIATLNELSDSEDAMAHYIKAVAGARAGREEVVLSGLRRAVELDGSLKDYAKKDAEFRQFAATEGFSAIVQ